MKNEIVYKNLVLWLVVLGFGGVVFSGDNLPIPDGGAVKTSLADLEGEISEITPSLLVILKKGTGENITVELTKQTQYFSAFGGFIKAAELLPGQTVWIWYENLRYTEKIFPKAAIVKIFSLDPKDKP